MNANMIRDPRIVPDCCNRVFVTSLFVFHSLYPYLMILDREIVYDLCNHAWNMSKQFSTQRLMGYTVYTPPSEQWLREKRWESRYKRVSRIHAYDGKPMPLLLGHASSCWLYVKALQPDSSAWLRDFVSILQIDVTTCLDTTHPPQPDVTTFMYSYSHPPTAEHPERDAVYPEKE